MHVEARMRGYIIWVRVRFDRDRYCQLRMVSVIG